MNCSGGCDPDPPSGAEQGMQSKGVPIAPASLSDLGRWACAQVAALHAAAGHVVWADLAANDSSDDEACFVKSGSLPPDVVTVGGLPAPNAAVEGKHGALNAVVVPDSSDVGIRTVWSAMPADDLLDSLVLGCVVANVTGDVVATADKFDDKNVRGGTINVVGHCNMHDRAALGTGGAGDSSMQHFQHDDRVVREGMNDVGRLSDSVGTGPDESTDGHGGHFTDHDLNDLVNSTRMCTLKRYAFCRADLVGPVAEGCAGERTSVQIGGISGKAVYSGTNDVLELRAVDRDVDPCDAGNPQMLGDQDLKDGVVLCAGVSCGIADASDEISWKFGGDPCDVEDRAVVGTGKLEMRAIDSDQGCACVEGLSRRELGDAEHCFGSPGSLPGDSNPRDAGHSQKFGDQDLTVGKVLYAGGSCGIAEAVDEIPWKVGVDPCAVDGRAVVGTCDIDKRVLANVGSGSHDRLLLQACWKEWTRARDNSVLLPSTLSCTSRFAQRFKTWFDRSLTWSLWRC